MGESSPEQLDESSNSPMDAAGVWCSASDRITHVELGGLVEICCLEARFFKARLPFGWDCSCTVDSVVGFERDLPQGHQHL